MIQDASDFVAEMCGDAPYRGGVFDSGLPKTERSWLEYRVREHMRVHDALPLREVFVQWRVEYELEARP